MKKKLVLVISILLITISLILPLTSCKKKNNRTEENGVPYTFLENSTIYIKMGTYPQTISQESVDTIKTNGTYDSQSGYYTYNNNKYKIITAHPCTDEVSPVFSNDEPVVDGKEYAFLVEDIVWKIINKALDDPDYFVYSNKILDTAIYQDLDKIGKYRSNYYIYDNQGALLYNEEVYANNWEYSKLRTTLAYFYNNAFNNANKTVIIQKEIANTSQDDGPDYFPNHQSSTKDYVFCLSKAEATNSRYGFTDEDKDRRLRPVTDYAIANGVFYVVNTSNAIVGWSWTRTAATTSNSVYKVSTAGELTTSYITSDLGLKIGYAPAMHITKI